VPQDEQLAALASLHELFQKESLEYWLFGGWAVDFHAGDATRAHDDLDVAVWAEDLSRVSSALEGDGWTHTPEDGEDGYTAFERNGVHLEVAFLARDEQGEVFTPLRSGGRGEWPQGTFEKDVRELYGVRARIIALGALKTDKSAARSDPAIAAKDAADVATMSRIGP
jgi:hypothetical protein